MPTRVSLENNKHLIFLTHLIFLFHNAITNKVMRKGGQAFKIHYRAVRRSKYQRKPEDRSGILPNVAWRTLQTLASALVLILSSPRCSMGDVSSRAGASEYGKASIDFLGAIHCLHMCVHRTAILSITSGMLLTPTFSARQISREMLSWHLFAFKR